MEIEKTGMELLEEYAEKNGYEYESSSNFKRLFLSPSDQFVFSKFIIFPVEKDFWFIAKDSFAGRTYSSSTFTGLYTVIDLDQMDGIDGIDSSFICHINTKDKWDFLFRWNRRKTGNGLIDNELTFTSNKKELPEHLFPEEGLPLFKKLKEQICPVSIRFENDYFPEFSSLKDKMIVGIETNYWIYEEKDADELIRSGVPLLKRLNHNYWYSIGS